MVEIRAILALFRFRVVSDTFPEVPLAKAFLDGPGPPAPRAPALCARKPFGKGPTVPS